jgi:hypothetical protein
MPIRVEHGPSMPLVGQLAYQTGQLQYRNKRRTELERLAMQQAEMRQRAAMQQQQIAASLQGQKMSHMSSMQRLQMQQQYGQINADQAYQRNLQLAEDSREHSMNLAEQYGENAIEHTKIRQGLADDADWKKAEWNWLVKTYDQDLNSAGQQHVQGLLSDRMRIQGDQRIPEDARPQALEQNMSQIQEAQNNPQYRIGRHQEIGYIEPWGEREDGSHTWNRTRVSVGKGDADWTYKPNLTRMIPDPRGHTQGPAPLVKSTISPQQWYTENTTYFDIDGVRHKSSPDMATGQMVITEVDTSKADSAREAQREKAIEYDIDSKDKWRNYTSDLANPQSITWEEWELDNPNPYRETPSGYEMFSGGEGSTAPQQPIPQPTPAQPSGMPGLGGGGFDAGRPGTGEEQFFQQEQQHQFDQQQQAQQIAPPDLNAPAGAPGTEPVVLDEEEAMRMVQAGQIPAGTIVQLPNSKKIRAGQPADPNDIPLMMRASQ